MFDPNKRIGDDEPAPKKGKPSFMVGIKFDPSKRLGDEPDGDEGGEAPGPDELMRQAAEGICRICNVSSSKAQALSSYLESFFKAADSKPHDEGEHSNEPGEGESGEYGEES